MESELLGAFVMRAGPLHDSDQAAKALCIPGVRTLGPHGRSCEGAQQLFTSVRDVRPLMMPVVG